MNAQPWNPPNPDQLVDPNPPAQGQLPNGGRIDDRPYDKYVLMDLVAHMHETDSTVISPPRAPGIPVGNEQGFIHRAFEFINRPINAARLAISGLSRVVTSEGRAERAQERAERLQQRIAIIAFVGSRIADPRQEPTNPAEKTGWLGIYKRDIDVKEPEGYKGDFTNMGKWLMKKDRLVKQPNLNRPATRSENAAVRRLHAKSNKRNALINKSTLLKESYDLPRAEAIHKLSRSEKRYMSKKVVKRSEKYERKAARATRQFEKIADSDDFRGRLAKLRLLRARGEA